MTGPADGPVGPELDGTARRRDDAALPAASAAARVLFGDALPAVQQYAELLATIGIAHGHLGPREVPRLWDRHLANSAVVTDLLPTGATVVDVGSGAGLPGIPMVLRRPDLHMVLVEPMLRRSTFLEQVVGELDLASRVQVLRGRAEEPATRVALGRSSWVTARAVAPLERLVGWCLPLLGPGGWLLALKGSSAADEVAQFARSGPRALRDVVEDMDVVELGREYDLAPTQVIRVQRGARRRRTQ